MGSDNQSVYVSEDEIKSEDAFNGCHTCFCDSLAENVVMSRLINPWATHAVSVHTEGTCDMLHRFNHRPPCRSLKCYSISVLWKRPRRNSCVHCIHSSDSTRKENTLSICNNLNRLNWSIFWMGYSHIVMRSRYTCIEPLPTYRR